jgi:hypothetical protein
MGWLLDVFTAAVVAGGVGIAVVKFLGKKLIEHRLSKDIERFRAELGQRSEALKTELSIYAHEQHVTINRVDTQRANAIHLVFAGLRRWSVAAAEVIQLPTRRIGSTRDQLEYSFIIAMKGRDLLSQAAQELADQAIYFDNETYGHIGEVVDKCASQSGAFLQAIDELRIRPLSEIETVTAINMACLSFQRAYESDIQPQLVAIAGEFRELLGTVRKV